MRVVVIGGGWAGIAAAVRATQAGHQVRLVEMAPQLGGRARSTSVDGLRLDNGQHILIGAYRDTLSLMGTVGADVDALLGRHRLMLIDAHGRGLRLPDGAAVPALVRGVLGHRDWSLGERLALLREALRWTAMRFTCDPRWTVERLTGALPPRVRRELIEPLCVAALNTPATRASAAVLLRVLRDALFGARGAADLLLPKVTLDELLPEPARRWLQRRGAHVQTGRRVQALRGDDDGWRVDDEQADAVILACTAVEAARLAREVAPDWAAMASGFEHEPIVTVYLRSEGSRLPLPMVALHEGADAPAQFVFDHGLMGATPGVFAAVVSGAGAWVERGLDATAQAVQRQLESALPAGTWREPPVVVRTLAEKRATFACVPGLRRPAPAVAHRLWAAGDYVEGPYPSTLEGAVRSGLAAADALG